jgi:hypothetical protein
MTAQGISARMGQDAQRLEAEPASPVAESHAPILSAIANITTGFILAAILLTPWVL